MKYKYGDFSTFQIDETIKYMQKQIFFLILIVDPQTKEPYSNVDVNNVFESVLVNFGGLNDILGERPALVKVMMTLKAAQNEYNNPEFDETHFRESRYRSLVLDAGNYVLSLKEV